MQPDPSDRAAFLSRHGRRTPFHSAQARLPSLDNGQLAQYACHTLLLQENALGQDARSSARNPNRYDTSIWISQLKIDDAFRVQYAIGCETPSGTIWDNNFGRNYLARRQRLKILTLNLHCYQEENQDAKFSQIARAIDDLDIDVVCLQEVAENWGEGRGTGTRTQRRSFVTGCTGIIIFTPTGLISASTATAKASRS